MLTRFLVAITFCASTLAGAQDTCGGGSGGIGVPQLPSYTVDVPAPVTLCLSGQLVPYLGTIWLHSDDPTISFPPAYTFTLQDNVFIVNGNYSYWEARRVLDEPIVFHAAGIREYFIDYSGPWTLRGIARVQVNDPVVSVSVPVPVSNGWGLVSMLLLVGAIAYRSFARRAEGPGQ